MEDKNVNVLISKKNNWKCWCWRCISFIYIVIIFLITFCLPYLILSNNIDINMIEKIIIIIWIILDKEEKIIILFFLEAFKDKESIKKIIKIIKDYEI